MNTGTDILAGRQSFSPAERSLRPGRQWNGPGQGLISRLTG
jgi:hypothetical protein